VLGRCALVEGAVTCWTAVEVKGVGVGGIAEGELLGALIEHDNCGVMPPVFLDISIFRVAISPIASWQKGRRGAYKTISLDCSGT
jgi:hypothetical protein